MGLPVGTSSEAPAPWVRTRSWLPQVALASALLYVSYIAASSFEVEGHRGFSLFDDAMISMRYARNLSHGDGLRWNVGEPPVEGYTNLLWTLWMAAVQLLPLPQRAVAVGVSLTSAALLVLNLWLVSAMVHRLHGRMPTVAFAVASCALSYPLIFWSLRGVEVGLLAFLLDAAILLAWRAEEAPHRGAALAVVLALTVLVRDDALVPVTIVVAFLAVDARTRRAARIAALAVTGTLAVHVAFRLAYYGAPLPNTYYLKLANIPLSARLARGGVAVVRTVATELLLAVVLAAIALVRNPRDRRLRLLLAVVAGQVASTIFVGGDAWESWGQPDRFLSIAIPALSVAAALGAEAVWVEPPARRFSVVLAVALVVRALGILMGDFVPRSFTVTPPFDARSGLHAPEGAAGWMLVSSLLFVAFALVAWRRTREVVWTSGVVAAVVVLGTVGTNWRDFLEGERTARQVAWDNRNAIFGIKLGEAAPPETTIAVVAAGSIPFFSNLTAVDLLGKNDAHIAREPPVERFVPGHDKRDYVYSLGEHTPEVVLELWHHSPEELGAIAALGYRALPNGMYVRRDCPESLVDLLLNGLPEYPFATHRPPPS